MELLELLKEYAKRKSLECCCKAFVVVCRLDEIIVFRQLSKSEVKEIADIMLTEVFKRAEIKGIKIDVTERFKVSHPSTSCCTGLGQLMKAFDPVLPRSDATCIKRSSDGVVFCHFKLRKYLTLEHRSI